MSSERIAGSQVTGRTDLVNSRDGKTLRDHLSGAWNRHLANQEKRREWNQAYARLAKSGGVRTLAYPKIGL